MKTRKSRKYRGGTWSDPKTWGNGSYYPYNHSPMLFGGPTYNDVYGFKLGGRRSRKSRKSRRQRGGAFFGLIDDRSTLLPNTMNTAVGKMNFNAKNSFNAFRGIPPNPADNPSPSVQPFLKL